MAEKFDAYAQSYESLHKSSVASSGEDPSYFHDYKIGCLVRRALLDGPVLDYGCGVGNLTERLVSRAPEVHGYDPSESSRAEARTRASGAVVHDTPESLPAAHFETAILSGVLHHVTPAERPGVLATVRSALRPGGRIVVFEHNPLNPLTRYAVNTCEFDEHAKLILAPSMRQRVREAGFASAAVRYRIFFPHALRGMRPLEAKMTWLPLGAQYYVVARKA